MRKRWQLFRATDFQSLMYPSFIFCRIFGTFPYKIDNSIFEISKPHYVVSIIVTCTLCVFELIIFSYSKTMDFDDVIDFVWSNSYGILSSFVAIITLVLSNPRMRLLRTIMEISSQLPPESYQKLSRLIHSKDIFVVFFVVSTAFIGFFIEMDVFIDVETDIFFLYNTYALLLVFQMDMLYMNCVCILKACLEEINNNLLHVQKFTVNNGSCIFMMSYYGQRYPCLITNLRTLKKQHLMISNTTQRLNKIFSLQLLAATVMTFFDIICLLYFYAVKWDKGLRINWNKNMIIFLIYVIHHVIRILLLVWACETAKIEAEKICTMIHDVLNSTKNREIKNELELFSLQVLHCKSTFFAKGFTMNARLLAMMTSTLTTYTLILFQFLIITHTR